MTESRAILCYYKTLHFASAVKIFTDTLIKLVESAGGSYSLWFGLLARILIYGAIVTSVGALLLAIHWLIVQLCRICYDILVRVQRAVMDAVVYPLRLVGV